MQNHILTTGRTTSSLQHSWGFMPVVKSWPQSSPILIPTLSLRLYTPTFHREPFHSSKCTRGLLKHNYLDLKWRLTNFRIRLCTTSTATKRPWHGASSAWLHVCALSLAYTGAILFSRPFRIARREQVRYDSSGQFTYSIDDGVSVLGCHLQYRILTLIHLFPNP
jgi:hypothetical protein